MSIQFKYSTKPKEHKKYNYNFFSLSTLILLITNILFSFYFLKSNGTLSTLIWVYWFQSVCIGISTFFRLYTQKKFTTEDLSINGTPVLASKETQKYISFFFLMHYGIFHTVYIGFMFIFLKFPWDKVFLIGIVLFLVNHTISFFVNFKNESNQVKNIGTMMFEPYPRILPIHIILLFAFFFNNYFMSITVILVFMILKTIADILMHIAEHKEVKLQDEF